MTALPITPVHLAGFTAFDVRGHAHGPIAALANNGRVRRRWHWHWPTIAACQLGVAK